MSLELSPMGVTCNLSCPYCYEHPMREAGNFLAGDAKKPYDVDLMIESLSKHNSRFSLFGGEPLLTAIEDLEKIWKWGYERYQINGVQTNGTLITEQHIELFKKYKVHVGISVDGPDELNDARWAGSLDNTRQRTAMSMHAIDRLLEEGHIPSFIVTLHKLNASPERLPRLKEWFREMDSRGVYSSRLHPLEIEYSGIGDTLALSPERNAQVMLAGHADRSGAASYNVGLSQRRADAAKAYLASKGIPDGVMTTQAFGESKPRVDTADGVREVQNRRVEISYGPGSGQ